MFHDLIHLLLKIIYVLKNLHLASQQLVLRYCKANNKIYNVVERIPGKKSRELGSNPNCNMHDFGLFALIVNLIS